jgi:hypothetical protein
MTRKFNQKSEDFFYQAEANSIAKAVQRSMWPRPTFPPSATQRVSLAAGQLQTMVSRKPVTRYLCVLSYECLLKAAAVWLLSGANKDRE